MDHVLAHERSLVGYALEVLEAVPGLTIYGPRKKRGGLVTFTMDEVHPHDLASILDHQGIAIRAGHHCTMPLHTRLGLAATARASFYVYNTKDDVDVLVGGLMKAREVFGLG